MQPLDTSRYADETLLVSVIKTLEGNGNDRSVSYISSAVDMGAGQGALNKVKLNLYQITYCWLEILEVLETNSIPNTNGICSFRVLLDLMLSLNIQMTAIARSVFYQL